jgi:thiamine biosynthesis protein ThiS
MAIEVNGETVPYIEGETISELLQRMNYVFPMVVVAVDGKLVLETEFTSSKFGDGAKIEVIHLTSGG